MNYGTLFDYIYKLDTYVVSKENNNLCKKYFINRKQIFRNDFFKYRKVIRLITFLQK